MTVYLKDRVKQITATTGTGTITFTSTPSGYQSFSSAYNDGDEVYYVIENKSDYEIGVGTYTANTLSRDTVLKSTNGGAKLSLTGRSTVFVSVPAEKTIYIDGTGQASINLDKLSDVVITAPASGEGLKYNGTNWVNGNISGYTDEQAQDAVAGMLVGSTGINLSYNDGANTLTIAATGLLQSNLNLADLTNAATARTNLGLGTAALSNSGDFYLSTNPSGYISASSVAAGYQPLDGDLTSLAAVTGVDTIYYRSATSTWSPVVIGTGILFSGGTLSNTLDLSSYATSTGVAALYTPLSRTITINGSGQDLTSNRSWTVGDLRSDSSYSDPTWLTSLAWSKISGTPTTLAGYGITDGITSSGVAASYVPYTGATGAVNLGSQSLTAGAITASSQFTNALGTITTSAPLTLTQTWNAAGVTFTGALINITNTASASASLLQDWQVGGSSKVSLRKDGQMTFYGTGSGLGLAQLTGYNSQWFIYSGGTFQSPLFNCNGWYGMVDGANGGMQFFSGHGIVWSGTGTSGTLVRGSLTGDVGLFRDGAGALIQRYSTTAQSFGISNTYTSSTNYEYGCLKWTSNEFRIGTAVGSAGGTQRNLVIGAWDSASTWIPKVVITPTATGAFYLGGVADNTSTNGNARGQYAIDLQLSRNAATQVASDYGVCIGTQCTASGNNASVAIGRAVNVTDSIGGAVGIGKTITLSGYRAVGIGANCVAVGDGIAIGTAANAAHSGAICFTGANSLWTGANTGTILWHASSNTEQMAGVAYNTGRIHGGGSETGTICVRTTSSTPTTLQSISYASHFNSTWRQRNKAILYEASFTITALRSDGAAARFCRRVVVKSVADAAGSTYTCSVLQTDTIGADVNEIAGASISITASSSQTLDISVTGEPNYACTGVSATNIITAVGHPFANNDIVVFTALTGGSSLSANPNGHYYLGNYKVINVSGNTFQLATPGSSATPLALGSDISAGTVARAILWTKVNSTFAVVASGY